MVARRGEREALSPVHRVVAHQGARTGALREFRRAIRAIVRDHEQLDVRPGFTDCVTNGALDNGFLVVRRNYDYSGGASTISASLGAKRPQPGKDFEREEAGQNYDRREEHKRQECQSDQALPPNEPRSERHMRAEAQKRTV